MRGILRLLALWVSKAYQEGFKGAHRDALIGLGTAPLDDPLFRAAVFEQLGESRLEGAVTTDICGKKDSFAIRLDSEAVETIKKARLHLKCDLGLGKLMLQAKLHLCKLVETLPKQLVHISLVRINTGL